MKDDLRLGDQCIAERVVFVESYVKLKYLQLTSTFNFFQLIKYQTTHVYCDTPSDMVKIPPATRKYLSFSVFVYNSSVT